MIDSTTEKKCKKCKVKYQKKCIFVKQAETLILWLYLSINLMFLCNMNYSALPVWWYSPSFTTIPLLYLVCIFSPNHALAYTQFYCLTIFISSLAYKTCIQIDLVLHDCDTARFYAMIYALASVQCTLLKINSQISCKCDRHFTDPQMLSLF